MSKRRREAALVADTGRQPARSAASPLSCVVDLGAHAKRLREGAGADRRDHELLEVDGVVGVQRRR